MGFENVRLVRIIRRPWATAYQSPVRLLEQHRVEPGPLCRPVGLAMRQ